MAADSQWVRNLGRQPLDINPVDGKLITCSSVVSANLLLDRRAVSGSITAQIPRSRNSTSKPGIQQAERAVAEIERVTPRMLR
jgi:hypothetical protein